ncbi:MAG: IclR helix-turn-helix domain, partial [Pseudonocardiales bacterium]|nr:IclR helix-turn-helix domain [Pseudonocardiales bacterium]
MTTPRLESVTQANRAVVEKAFAVLEAWDHRGETLGASELARRTGLPKSTSHRVLGILEAAG